MREYSQTFTARASDIDELGHVNNAVWVRWVQDLATAHWAVAASAATWALPALVVEGEREKFDAFAAGTAALAASGTVALELALARLPTVICYRLNPLTVALYRRFMRVRYANLVNLMLDRMSAPELLQEDCRPDLLHRELARLLDDPAARAAQIADVAAVSAWLGEGEVPPSRRAAQAVLDCVMKGM